MAELEESVVNYARRIALQGRRANSGYRFNEISIRVTTEPNSGMLFEIYWNKCFFIALSHGLKKLGYDVDPLTLMKICGFLDPFEMIDTDKPEHARLIQFLADTFEEFQICVYIGSNVAGQWYTTPDYSAKFGNGPNIIRILNKGVHFELITSSSDEFVRDVRTMTLDRAYFHQHEVMRTIQQVQEDRRRAEEEHTRYIREEAMRQIQLDEDYVLALQFQELNI